MKQTILAATLVLCSSITAFATSPIGVRQADLNEYRFDEAYSLKKENIKRGIVQLDLVNNQVTVTLERAMTCPPRMHCMRMVMAPVVFTAALLDTKIGACNERIYTALTDKTRGDGARVSIEVIDNSKMTCMTFVAVPATEVKVQTLTPRPRELMNHYFSGPALVPGLQ